MKKLRLLFTVLVMSMALSMTALAGEWKQDNTGWWYQNDDDGYPANTWQTIDGKHYYFNENGYILINTTTPDGQQVDENGVLVQKPLFDYDIEDCHVTYVRHEVSTDYEGNPCVIVYYNYTNKSDEEKSAMGNSCYIKAYQNGIECERATISYNDKNEAIDNRYKNVMTGITLEVAEAFKLSDTSDVTLTLKDLFDWTGDSPKANAVLSLN